MLSTHIFSVGHIMCVIFIQICMKSRKSRSTSVPYSTTVWGSRIDPPEFAVPRDYSAPTILSRKWRGSLFICATHVKEQLLVLCVATPCKLAGGYQCTKGTSPSTFRVTEDGGNRSFELSVSAYCITKYQTNARIEKITAVKPTKQL